METATIYLETETRERLTLQVLIVPTIAAPIHATRQSISSLPYLRNLKLAHPFSEQSEFEIALLIGADFYWDIVGDETIRGKGPTSVSYKVGYLISGPVQRKGSNKNTISMNNVLTYHKAEETNLEKTVLGNREYYKQ